MRVNLVISGNRFYKSSGPMTYANTLEGYLRDSGVSVERNGRGRYDVVHVNDIMPLSLRRLRQDSFNLATGHAIPSTMVPRQPQFFWRSYLRWFYSRFDRIIAVSNSSCNELKQLLPDADITVLENPVDLRRFRPDPEGGRDFRRGHSIGDGKRVILSVGRAVKDKGVKDFVEISKRFPDHHFMWAGPVINPLRASGSVSFLGAVDDIAGAYNAADVFLFPSHGESYSLVILEAAACGLPVVARDIAAYDAFDFVLRCRDLKEFEQRLRMLEDKREYGRQSRKSLRGARRFSAKNYIRDLIKIYEESTKSNIKG